MNPKRTPMLVAITAALPLLAACDRDPDRDAAVAPTMPPATVTEPAPVPPVTTQAPVERMDDNDTVGENIEQAGDALERQGDRMGAAIDDATITAKVKAALVADPTLSALEVDVDTIGGVVTLRGDVETQIALERAATIARETEGVVSVDNQLVVSSG